MASISWSMCSATTASRTWPNRFAPSDGRRLPRYLDISVLSIKDVSWSVAGELFNRLNTDYFRN
jgi:hypothetical protein